ncbi:MAG: ABC transporter ATP-binding protein [Deltaproteobacteria bacterium]|nr:ABC transporter ATP-binding protein [Deltaproteobacteria bacterium]
MIKIDDFSFVYPGSGKPALEHISLQAEKGELILIRGASGSGKSTLLYCINGLVPHIFNGNYSGRIQVNGFSPSDISIRELSKTVGTVFQNADSQIFMMRVEDDVAFGCENLLMPREEIIRRRDGSMKEMGLWEMRTKETYKLSGGQKQRLAISSIYAMGPEIFLFDEPTTDLDQDGRKDFFGILTQLKRGGKLVILAEHQYEEYMPLVDRVITLHEGRLVSPERAPEYPPGFLQGYGKENEVVISCKSVDVAYEKGETALKNINLEIRKGEVVALSGRNGSGKTTLLKSLAGILRPDAGVVTIFDMANPSLEMISGRVGFLFQNPDEQLFAGCVEEEIAFGPKHLGKRVDVERYLHLSGLSNERGRHPQTLSRGQRQLLAVTSVLAMEPDILLLDEPTTGLDDVHWMHLFSLLSQYSMEGKTVVYATHNRKAAGTASRVVHLDDGRIISDEIYQ